MAHEELPPLNITPGAIRFNTDSMKLEYFRIGMEGGSTSSYAGIGTLAAGEWVQLTTDTPDIQTGGTRMVMGGGLTPGGGADDMIYTNVSSTGNTINFGDFAAGSITHSMQAGSSRTRGIFAGGYRNNIEFITISSTGNAQDFGDKINWVANTSQGYCSNSTRMLTFNGYNSTPSYAATNEIQKIEMSTLGNSQDFGDTQNSEYFLSAVASPTRAVFGSQNAGLQYVTFSTQGNSASFGSISNGVKYSAHSNAVRGVFSGMKSNTMCQYVTIATLGDAQDFGDLTVARKYNCASGSSTRGVIAGGYTPSYSNTMDYYQIATTGDLVDFGDLQEARLRQAALSNGHGGLG